jgi:pentatricopeptide repeat protein
MRERGLAPTRQCFTALVSALCRGGETAKAVVVVERMHAAGLGTRQSTEQLVRLPVGGTHPSRRKAVLHALHQLSSPLTQRSMKVANRANRDSGGQMSSRGRFATPADFPRHDSTPYRGLRGRRWGLGCVHRSRPIFGRPNPKRLTIRCPVRCRSGSWRRRVRRSWPRACCSSMRRRRTAMKKLRIVILGFGTARQKTVLE